MIVVVKRVKQNLARIVHFVIQASIIVTVRLGTISEIDVVDLKFRVFYILLLNSITVKNMKFQCIKKEYIIRKLIENCTKTIMYIFQSNYVNFLSPFRVITKTTQNRAGRLQLVLLKLHL